MHMRVIAYASRTIARHLDETPVFGWLLMDAWHRLFRRRTHLLCPCSAPSGEDVCTLHAQYHGPSSQLPSAVQVMFSMVIVPSLSCPAASQSLSPFRWLPSPALPPNRCRPVFSQVPKPILPTEG